MSKEKKEKVQRKDISLLDRDAFFEVLDRAFVMQKAFTEMLLKHPAVKQTPQLRATCNVVAVHLGELIQAAGERVWDMDDEADKYKAKYEKCIATIKKFDAGLIGMYDL